VVCDFGDVVIVPFPFVDAPEERRRPSVVLSKPSFNTTHSHSILAMITTAARSHWPTDIPISDLLSAGLPHSCVVRWKLFTLPNALMLRRAGALGPADREALVKVSREILH
jgi:mRNA interferase MazF